MGAFSSFCPVTLFSKQRRELRIDNSPVKRKILIAISIISEVRCSLFQCHIVFMVVINSQGTKWVGQPECPGLVRFESNDRRGSFREMLFRKKVFLKLVIAHVPEAKFNHEK